MRRKLFTLAAAVSLVLPLSAGCVYIPAADAPAREGGPDPNRLVGARTSSKSVRPGAVTREQAVSLLGTPRWQSPDGQSSVYQFNMKAGYWLVLPFFAVVRAKRQIAVRLDFDSAGVLCAVRKERGDHSPMHFLGPTPPTPRMLEELPWPATQSTTSPVAVPATTGLSQ